MPRTRRLMLDEGDETKTIAVFVLDGDRLAVTWLPGSELLRPEIELWGVLTADGNIPLTDGARFFDALPLAFSRSSFLAVVDGDE